VYRQIVHILDELKVWTTAATAYVAEDMLQHIWQEVDNRCDVCKLDCLCGLVVRVLGYRSGGLGSIPGTTREKKK
jgi:hypothetical protein